LKKFTGFQRRFQIGVSIFNDPTVTLANSEEDNNLQITGTIISSQFCVGIPATQTDIKDDGSGVRQDHADIQREQ
jgi:hypothetical protein